MTTLQTARTRLTPLKREDFGDVIRMYRDDPSFEYISAFQDATEEDYFQFLKEKLEETQGEGWEGFWVVRSTTESLAEPETFVGTASLNRHDASGLPQMGGIVRERFWGRGLATEIGRRLVRHARREVGRDAVYALTEPENAAARRVVEKVGPDAVTEQDVAGKRQVVARFGQKGK